jgi:Fur family peroxide stress response transcriptional regulator
MREEKQAKNIIEMKLSEFEKRCKTKGLKITPQRIAVYKVLIDSVDHPTAEEVYQQVRKELNNISLDTVNRTLHTLTQIGAAFLVEGTGQPKRYDGGLEDHQHFRCMQCGAVIDFHYKPFDNIHVPEQFAGQFTVLRKSVYFEGICSKCTGDKQVMN